MKHQEIVMIVDFGGQYAQLIARRVRECGVYCEILPYNKSAKEILAQQPKGIIFSGGPSSVNAENAPEIDPDVFKAGVRVIGEAAILAEGDAAKREDIIFLAPLPLFEAE